MKKLLAAVVFFSLFLSTSYAVWENRIDMGISPIRDEFSVTPGSSTKRTIKFYNNSASPSLVYITSEDCVQGENYGAPKCRAYAGTWVSDPDHASTWISIDWADRFTVPARSEKIVSYTVNVPSNATPGWHYGAVFFNNPWQWSTGNSVDMVRRIGMLYLLNVPGNIIVDTELGDILIDIPNLNSAPDIWDRLKNNIGDTTAWNDIWGELNPFWEKPVLSKTDLQISLNIPVQNSGNIHIKPTGKIFIYDGEVMLTRIGKESIVDENGVYKGEKIVDYLPINDEGGNVLPDSERIFHIDWMGFASQEIGQDGNSIISFESPSDYFARMSEDNAQFIYPWEKLSLRSETKHLKAQVEFSFKNPKTGNVEVSTLELPITITYNYIAKTLNWWVILIVLLIILLAWIIIRRRDTQIEELEVELDDEIAALEKAQKALLVNKKSPTKKPPVVKEKEIANKATPSVKKTQAKKTIPAEVPVEKAPTTSPVKKTPQKKVASPAPTKKPVSTIKKTTAAPVKAPVSKETPAKKPVAKRPPAK
jgi:hypothetical protein